jgi:CHAT domain-containing protein
MTDDGSYTSKMIFHNVKAERMQVAGRDMFVGDRDEGRREVMDVMRILFLAANPRDTTQLDLEEELRDLERELHGVKFRDSIELIARHAVRPDDLVRHVRAKRPNVIHFSGHGSAVGIVLRNDSGGYHEVEGRALKRFLEGRGVDLVVLNACHSKNQADTIRGAVKTVIGTTAEVDDEAARRFSVAFYRSLGDGLSVGEAFRDGGDAVALHGLGDVFHSDGKVDLVLVGAASR